MATVRLQVKYFNSFWLKKTMNGRFNRDGLTNTQIPSSSTNITVNSYKPSWPSDVYGGVDYPPFGADIYSGDEDDSRNWLIEEARIKGGFNNTSTSYGARAYLKDENNEQSRLDYKIIYSGIYNSTTLFNETNVFSTAESIIKSLDPANGSIQRLFAEDTNMITFQENKVSNVLVDKDAIYSAEGGGTVTSAAVVLGQVTPYLGEYGISKNPESFAVFGYRKYFVDKYRNSVLRLSRDGITEISQYGMGDYFRDNLKLISDNWVNYTSSYSIVSFSAVDPFYIELSSVPTDLDVGMEVLIKQPPGPSGEVKILSALIIGLNSEKVYIDTSPINPDLTEEVTFIKYIKDQIVGGYDPHDDLYKVSIQKSLTGKDELEVFSPLNEDEIIEDIVYDGNTQTLSFDETVNGWTSFYSYRPDFLDDLRNDYYTFKGSEVWRHHDGSSDRTYFYNTKVNSSITFIFNANPSIMKNFNTISYEGTSGWEVEFFQSDSEDQTQDVTNEIKSYEEGKYTDGGVTYRSGFDRKESRYVANLVNNSQQHIGEVVFGDQMSGIKGYYVTVKGALDDTTNVGQMKELFAVSSNFVISSY